MRDYIRPYKVMAALHWLKENNPHYENVLIDTNWLKKFEHQAIFEHIIEEDESDAVDVQEDQKKEGDGTERMEVDNDHEEGNSKKCTSIEHVEGTERMEVDNDHEEGKSKKCTIIEHVEGKMNLDSGEMKRTNGKEKKDGHDQDSENEDNEAEEDENLEEAQKDYDQGG